MNENELADKLHTEDVQFSQQSLNAWAEEADTMLRQQQAEIEALRAMLQEAIDGMGGSYAIWAPKAKELLK